MNEEQKRILEDIHKKTENLMVEKANLTLIARKSILEGNYPDNILLEQIRKIDEAIAGVYRDQIENIRKNSKKIKDAAIKKYGNPIITDDKKTEYYSTGPNRIIFKTSELSKAKIRIDSAQFELYEQLFREINNIEEEQRILWVHTHGGKKSKTDLEKILRANINDMQSIMPTLQENLKIENELANMDLEEKKEKLSELQQDIQERQSRHGSQRNRILYSEKKEANKTNREINELNNEIINNEAISIDSEKSQHEIEIEASERKKEIQKQHQKEQEDIKQQRREENERRRQENIRKQQEKEAKIAEQKRLEEQKKLEEQKVQKVKSIARPKNKMSLKEKLKRVAVAAVAAVTAFTAGIGLFNGRKNEKSNEIPNLSQDSITETYDKEKVSQQNNGDTEKKENAVTISYKTQDSTTSQENEQIVSQDIHISEAEDIEYTETTGLWGTVKIGDKIYNNMNSALNHQNALKPYFDSDKEYTIVGVTYSNGVQTTSVDTTMQNCNELEETLKSQGFKPQGYMITTKRADEIDLTNINNLDGKITGYVSVEDIVKQANMEQGRAR